MQSPVETYRSMKKIDNIEDEAHFELYVKYVQRDLRKEKKLTQIESTDQESQLTSLTGGFPIPGMIYTFLYDMKKAHVAVNVDGGTVKYRDLVPMVFCTKTEGKMFYGINLNTLPQIERVGFFEVYWGFYKEFFSKEEELTQNNQTAINSKFLTLAKTGQGQQLVKMFNQITGSNFNYGYRSYDLEKVINLRMVEFSEWRYIPFFNPKNAFQLMNHAQIQQLYWRTR